MTLSYALTADAPQQLMLELNPSGVRLIFPPPPAVVYLVVFSVMLGILALFTTFLVAVTLLIRSSIRQIPWIFFIFPVVFLGSMILFSMVSARDLWKKYRFCPREIFSVAFDDASFIQEHVTWKRRRIRRWPLTDITSASCKPLRFALTRGKAASLRVGFRRRLPFIRTIHGERDIQLALEFVERFQTALATSRG